MGLLSCVGPFLYMFVGELGRNEIHCKPAMMERPFLETIACYERFFAMNRIFERMIKREI